MNSTEETIAILTHTQSKENKEDFLKCLSHKIPHCQTALTTLSFPPTLPRFSSLTTTFTTHTSPLTLRNTHISTSLPPLRPHQHHYHTPSDHPLTPTSLPHAPSAHYTPTWIPTNKIRTTVILTLFILTITTSTSLSPFSHFHNTNLTPPNSLPSPFHPFQAFPNLPPESQWSLTYDVPGPSGAGLI